MVAVRMVQVAVNEVIDMIAVRHRLMSAAGPMAMVFVMTTTAVPRSAAIRVLGTDFQHMLVHMVAVGMMQMAVVQIIDVILMAHGHMAALRTMVVWMPFVNRVIVAIHIKSNHSQIRVKIKQLQPITNTGPGPIKLNCPARPQLLLFQ
jgi:hypothetical protein